MKQKYHKPELIVHGDIEKITGDPTGKDMPPGKVSGARDAHSGVGKGVGSN